MQGVRYKYAPHARALALLIPTTRTPWRKGADIYGDSISWSRDDGPTFAYERGEFMRLEMQWEATWQLRASLTRGSKMFAAATRGFAIEIAGASFK